VIYYIEKKYYSIDDKDSNIIKGSPAFSGKVRGNVLNLMETKIDKTNKIPTETILVTSMTHPDDVPLIKKSKAVVTDEGGILSHAAITARELKIPCVIGTKFATKMLKNGTLVEVDADAGVVRVLG
jgi:pyruvate,water dikinase